MSYLHLPRIHFKGNMTVNVPTANNDDVTQIINIADVSVQEPEGELVGPELRQCDQTFKQSLHSLVAGRGGKEEIRASWNYYGDFKCRFEDVTVTGVHHKRDRLIPDTSNDTLLGARVSLGRRTVMVDVDPESVLSSQIFSDNFKVAIGNEIIFQGLPTTIHSRWHYHHRNLAYFGQRHFGRASAVWQAAIPLDQLEFGELQDSPTYQALRIAAEAGQGVSIRFCIYFFEHTRSHKDLAKKFAQDEFIPNPAYGQVIGTISPWLKGELATTTAGRYLVKRNILAHQGEGYYLGPTLASVDLDREVITLDLITTFPERDKALRKIDKGAASLRMSYQEGGEDVISNIPYDRATYENGAGIVEIKIPPDIKPDDLADGLLQIYFDDFHNGRELWVLREKEIAIETDRRGIYLQENGQPETIVLHIYNKGEPAQTSIALKLEQYIMTDLDRSVSENRPVPNDPVMPNKYIVDMALVSLEDGKTELTLTPKKAGTCIIRFFPVEQPSAKFRKYFPFSFFINVRVFPEDNFADVDDSDLTYDFIYQKALRYFNLLYPGASKWPGHLDFGNEPHFQAKAKKIKERINKKIADPDYMPISRDLSDGKRKLLTRWCDLISNTHS